MFEETHTGDLKATVHIEDDLHNTLSLDHHDGRIPSRILQRNRGIPLLTVQNGLRLQSH